MPRHGGLHSRAHIQPIYSPSMAAGIFFHLLGRCGSSMKAFNEYASVLCVISCPQHSAAIGQDVWLALQLTLISLALSLSLAIVIDSAAHAQILA